jgi:hypothetical protein
MRGTHGPSAASDPPAEDSRILGSGLLEHPMAACDIRNFPEPPDEPICVAGNDSIVAERVIRKGLTRQPLVRQNPALLICVLVRLS